MNTRRYSTAAARPQRPHHFLRHLDRLARRDIEAAIEALIQRLDALDGDPDLEPEEIEEEDREDALQPVSLDARMAWELRA